jgi:general secretion pathway protein G
VFLAALRLVSAHAVGPRRQRSFVMRREIAFTLIEVMIVVAILGILAAIVVPQFSDAGESSKLGALKTNLQTVRAQIELYRMQHNDAYPTNATTFTAQMTTASKSDGTTAAIGTAGFNLGPYLGSLPENPYTGTNTLGTGGIGSSAWYYNGSTGQFRANHHADYTTY